MASSRTWFITGTSSGFGRALTEQLLARGDRVAATLRNMNALDDLRARYGDRLWAAQLDVTDTAMVRQVVEQAFAELGRIDVVCNNAGYGLLGACEEYSDAQVQQQISTNLMGSIEVTRAALPHLRRQGGGRILQVSSMGGQIAFPAFSIYHAAKWGIEGFVEALAWEVAPFNIALTLVEPGNTRTAFNDKIIAAPAKPEYDATPVGDLRRRLAADQFPPTGDTAKVARAMIEVAEQEPAPRRVALGSDTYTLVRAALTDRLAALDAQKAIAFSVDLEK